MAQVTSKDAAQEMDKTIDESVVIAPDVSHLITEDDTPVDNWFSEKQMRLLTEPLYSSWSGPGDDRTFVAMANVGLFFTTRHPALVPDVLLSTDVTLPEEMWQKEHRSYFIWEYGKPPDIVIEIVSNRKGGELGNKLLDYARLGVSFYVVFDPDQQISDARLRIFGRQGARFAEISDALFADIGLGLVLWEGDYEGVHETWLRWCDRSGAFIATGREAAIQAAQVSAAAQQVAAAAQQAAADAQQAAADAQQVAADAQQAAADAQQVAADAQQRLSQAEERAAQLAARLRALGVDPDA